MKTISGEDRLFGALNYIIIVLLPLFILFTEKKGNRFLAFHAYQSLMLFALAIVYSLCLSVLSVIFRIAPSALGILLIPLYWAPLLIFLLMAYHAWKGKRFRFPVVGGEAAKLAS